MEHAVVAERAGVAQTHLLGLVILACCLESKAENKLGGDYYATGGEAMAEVGTVDIL